MHTQPFRWGILSTGHIAHDFATAVTNVDNAVVAAVGSRSQASADAFAKRFAIPTAHPSYEALAHDPTVDAIYIGTPHPFHAANTIMCLQAGKHVLVEKPFAMNARQAQQMVDVARQQGVFLMEAMWSRFIPAMAKARALMQEGRVGEVRMFEGNFGFRTAYDPASRLFDPALGGGALLDVGIYPISIAAMVFGATPASVSSEVSMTPSGVDEQCAVVMRYDGGQIAQCSAALRTHTTHDATFYGETGRIHIEPLFYRAERLYHAIEDNIVERWHLPIPGHGFEYQIMEAMQCITAGHTESAVMPLDDSVAIMALLDRIRQPWGLRYAADDAD